MIRSEDVFTAMVDFNLKMSGARNFQAQVPTYVGTTGIGKTTRIANDAEHRGWPVYRLLLQSMLPEDVLGIPRVINGVTEWSLPRWAEELSKRPGYLFLDEMDKARPECHSAALTLLAEKRLRDTVLHKDTVIVSAMQPVSQAEWLSDQTGQALSARMCFIPVVADWGYLSANLGVELDFLPTSGAVELPVLTQPSPRQVDWFVQFCRHNPKNKEMWEAVAQGMFTKDISNALIETVSKGLQGQAMTREDLVELMKEEQEKLIGKLSIPELVLLAPDTFHYGTPETLKATLVRVWAEGSEEDATNWLEHNYRVISDRLAASPDGALEVVAGAPEDAVRDAIEEAARIVGEEHWALRSANAEAKAAPTTKAATSSKKKK